MREKMGLIKEKGLPLVSVIVPVYNVEDYLEQCLNSICAQTLSRIEIIVIDDGSIDNSGQICDVFAMKDPRIKVIHKKNEGLSAARNDGIALARAEYIMFVDSDDWVEPEFCEMPFCIAEENGAEIVAFGIHKISREGRTTRQIVFSTEGFISKEDALTKYWPFVGVMAWNKMYRRDLFNDIQYPVGHLSEDTATTHRVIYKAQSIFLLDRPLYYYRVSRYGSITEAGTAQYLKDYTRYTLQRLDDLRAWGYDCKEEGQRLAISYLAQYGRYQEKSPVFEKILQECSHFTKNTSWRQKTMYRVFRISPGLFDLISILTGRRRK